MKPPFPKLPIFNVTALVLSYVAYIDDVHELLNVLSKGTALYHRKHEAILSQFMTVYKPQLTTISFGDEKEEWDRIYPKEDQLEHIAKLKGIKLKEVWIRN